MALCISLVAVLKFGILLQSLLSGVIWVKEEVVGGTAGGSAVDRVRLRGSADYHRRTTCRICGSSRLQSFIDFGRMPLANAFRTAESLDTPEALFPLSAACCGDCGLVQVPDVVRPEVLFQHYTYFSSASQPMVEHFKRQSEFVASRYVRSAADLVCEIGSNDGIFLRNLVGRCRTLGIDPADNIAATAAAAGVQTANCFFNPRTAGLIRELFGPSRVVFAANCFAHIDDIHGIMAGLAKLMARNGVFVFENHRFADMLSSHCFDQIYHEHLCFYTLRPIEHLMGQYGMHVIDVQRIPTHGESFQVHVAFADSGHVVQDSVEEIRRQEQEMGLEDVETYRRWAEDVARLRVDLRELLVSLVAQGKCVAGYGAPGKGTTLLRACGIGEETLTYIVDSTPIKQGRFMPGTRIPILPPETLRMQRPDYLLLLSWNYAEAILRKEASLREQGTRFIIPFPELRMV